MTPSDTGDDKPPPQDPAAPAGGRPADPERGLRGAMSAILILEAVTVLLAITLINNGGQDAPAYQIVILVVLAALHIGTCAVVSRRFAVGVIVALQLLLLACWAISGAIGAMGIVFGLVWACVLYLRREFRRRLAAGTIPGQ